MGARSRRKGAKGERDISERLRTFGFLDARRNLSQSRTGKQEGGDIFGEDLRDYHIEVKTGKSFTYEGALRQAVNDNSTHDRLPVAVCRRDNGEAVAVLRADDLFLLLALAAPALALCSGFGNARTVKVLSLETVKAARVERGLEKP